MIGGNVESAKNRSTNQNMSGALNQIPKNKADCKADFCLWLPCLTPILSWTKSFTTKFVDDFFWTLLSSHKWSHLSKKNHHHFLSAYEIQKATQPQCLLHFVCFPERIFSLHWFQLWLNDHASLFALLLFDLWSYQKHDMILEAMYDRTTLYSWQLQIISLFNAYFISFDQCMYCIYMTNLKKKGLRKTLTPFAHIGEYTNLWTVEIKLVYKFISYTFSSSYSENFSRVHCCHRKICRYQSNNLKSLNYKCCFKLDMHKKDYFRLYDAVAK